MDVNQYRLYCNTCAEYKYVWNTVEPTACPIDAAHTIDLESIAVIERVSPTTLQEVVTQLEKNDKDLKLAKSKVFITEGVSGVGVGVCSIRIPGNMANGDGRYVGGGYAIVDTYDPDDFVLVRVEDSDRQIAWMIALAINPEATEPVSDETIKAMGVIDAFGKGFPAYPEVKTYTDDEMAEENRGWFFWPIATGLASGPVGECEVEPIGGYGFLPAGMYLTLEIRRPNKTDGSMRVCFFWGQESLV